MKRRGSPVFAMWLLITLTLVIFVGLSFYEDIHIGDYTLTKARFKETLLADAMVDTLPHEKENIDTVPPAIEEVIIEPDTTIHNVLVFGDSMNHHLAMSIAKYGTVNNYKVTGVSWESSSTLAWSQSGKLKTYLEMTKPDFVIISLGSNEMDLKNFDLRVPAVRDIVAQLGEIPFVWVGPPLWKNDKGLYKMLEEGIPHDKFFPTGHFEMERGKDHIHPTKQGADQWADTLMQWISKSRHPILTVKPDTGTSIKGHKIIYLHPGD